MLFFQLMKHEMLPVEGAPQAKQYTVYTKQQMGYNSHTRAQAHKHMHHFARACHYTSV